MTCAILAVSINMDDGHNEGNHQGHENHEALHEDETGFQTRQILVQNYIT